MVYIEQIWFRFILRKRARNRTGRFGKLQLCWLGHGASDVLLSLLRAQGYWGLYMALLGNWDSEDKRPAGFSCRHVVLFNHDWALLQGGDYGGTSIWPFSWGRGRWHWMCSTVLGSGSLLCADNQNLVSGSQGEVLMAMQLSGRLPGTVLMSVYDPSWCLQWFWCNKWTPF